MKQQILFQRFFALLLLCAVSTLSWAYSFEVDGIYYNYNSTGPGVYVTFKNTSYNSYSGNVEIPVSVSYGGKAYDVTGIGSHAFYGCTNLTNISIPNTVTHIDDYAFYNCFAITSVVIPENVTTIDTWAFCNCVNLKSITLPESITNIRAYAFSGCYELAKTEYSSIEGLCKISFEAWDSNPLSFATHLYINGVEIKNVVVPEGVTSIGDYSFNYCKLTSITIPNSVTSIGKKAFEGCSELTTVTINSNPILSKKRYYVRNGGGVQAFFGTQVKEIIVGDDVTSIGEYAFSGCTGLTSVILSENLNSLSTGLFYGSSDLTSIKIPNSMESIGESAFYGCSGLTSIVIPKNVKSINRRAFYNCI